MLDLNLFENKRKDDGFVNKFVEELKSVLNKKQNDKNNELDEYNLYEKKKVFLDNRSRTSNELVWVMDNNSVCISENGDGGPISISKIDLPQDIKIGEVYEKIDNKYVYNPEITIELNKII